MKTILTVLTLFLFSASAFAGSYTIVTSAAQDAALEKRMEVLNAQGVIDNAALPVNNDDDERNDIRYVRLTMEQVLQAEVNADMTNKLRNMDAVLGYKVATLCEVNSADRAAVIGRLATGADATRITQLLTRCP